MIYYFSGTGNSRMVAQRIAEMTGDQAVAINQRTEAHKGDSRILGLVFPVYAWGVPRVMLRFLYHLAMHRKPTYVFAVCTCGDDIGKTDSELRRQLEKKQWPLDAMWSVIMPNTYIALPGFDIDPNKVALAKLEKAAPRIAAIAECVKKRQRGITDVHPGSFAALKSYVLRPLFNGLLTGDQYFKTSDDCTHCQLCAKVCPMQNIDYGKDGKPQWKNHCADCLACYHSCPRHAISYGPFTQNKGQYLLRKFLKSVIAKS